MSADTDSINGTAAAPVDALPATVSVSDADSDAVPQRTSDDAAHASEISASGSENGDAGPPNEHLPRRPAPGERQQSGSMIIPHDSEDVERRDEVYDESDARTMSPRRTSDEIERMSVEARRSMVEQARALQASLLEVVEKVETVKSEQEKLEGGNRFLQSYIGELMQTSKITSVGAPKRKGKARGAK